MISVNFLELVEQPEQPKKTYKPSGPVMPGEIVRFDFDDEGNMSSNIFDAVGDKPWRRK